MTNEGRPSELEKECENATALFASESGKQGNLLKGIDKKTVRREGIEPENVDKTLNIPINKPSLIRPDDITLNKLS